MPCFRAICRFRSASSGGVFLCFHHVGTHLACGSEQAQGAFREFGDAQGFPNADLRFVRQPEPVRDRDRRLGAERSHEFFGHQHAGTAAQVQGSTSGPRNSRVGPRGDHDIAVAEKTGGVLALLQRRRRVGAGDEISVAEYSLLSSGHGTTSGESIYLYIIPKEPAEVNETPWTTLKIHRLVRPGVPRGYVPSPPRTR